MDGVFTRSTNMLIIGQNIFSRAKVSLWECNPNGQNFYFIHVWLVVSHHKWHKVRAAKKKNIIPAAEYFLTSHLTSNCFNILPKSILLLYITIIFPIDLRFFIHYSLGILFKHALGVVIFGSVTGLYTSKNIYTQFTSVERIF